MLWVTREYLHLDRVATPWLISRFVDQHALFCYVPWGKEYMAPADAIPFAIPGAELGPYDEKGSTFSKVLRKYNLVMPGLQRLAGVIEHGIDYFLHGYHPTQSDTDGQIAIGLLAFAEDVMLTNQNDDAILSVSFPVYDALYANFSSRGFLKFGEAEGNNSSSDGRGPSSIFEKMREEYNKNINSIWKKDV